MHLIEIARAIHADKEREIEVAIRRRRLLAPAEAPDRPAVAERSPRRVYRAARPLHGGLPSR
ncbi:MAG: hypothetical protein ACXW4T_00755 [Candidatus Limnocylindrales bacterium]